MASTNKSTLLGLSQWLSTDKPKRADFVADNSIIDEILGGHVEDDDIHLSEAQKNKLDESFSITTYEGTGGQYNSLVMTFPPSFVMVFACDKPPIDYEDSVMKLYSGFCVQGNNTSGLYVDGREVRIYQNSSATDGIQACMNEDDITYVVVAFR